MTCIVGIRKPGGGALIGFDSASGGTGAQCVRATPKAHQPQPWLAWGFTTSWRFGQILQYHLDIPAGPCPSDPLDWLCREFVPAAREALKEHGYVQEEKSRQSAGTMVIACGDRVFNMYDEFEIIESTEPFTSAGSGWTYAEGALKALEIADISLSVEECARIALRSAAHRDAYVLPPFGFLHTEGSETETG